MKILSVASLWPYPPDDGTRTRTWNLLSRLAATEDVTLLTWIDGPIPPDHLGPVEKAVATIVTIQRDPADLSLAAKLRRRWQAQRRKIPSYVIERMERQRVPQTKELSGPFDVLVAEDDAAFYLLPDLSAPVVVNRHNIFTDTIETLLASGTLGASRKLKLQRELEIWRSYDRSLSATADLNLVTTSEAQHRLLEMLPGAKVEVVRNGVDIPQEAHDPGAGSKVVFIGGMSYEPNVDAVVWFCEQVWPLVLERVPEARFEVIGREPVERLYEIQASGLRIVGEVADMVEACRGARLGVVPLRAGSGIKNKTLELMAMGLPVVATSQGVEGFEGKGAGYFVTEDPPEMAKRIVDLLQDPQLARAEGGLARETAAGFSWDEAAQRLRELLSELVGSAGGRDS